MFYCLTGVGGYICASHLYAHSVIAVAGLTEEEVQHAMATLLEEVEDDYLREEEVQDVLATFQNEF